MESENERLSQLKDMYRAAEPGHTAFMQRFRRNMRFVVGGAQQWDPDVVSRLDADGKPHLTYNEILPKINSVFGEYLANMQQVQVVARRGGMTSVAAVLTALAKHAMDVCGGESAEAEAFLWGLIGGEGWLHWRIDYTSDPFNGDPMIEPRWPGDIVVDETAVEYEINKSAAFLFDSWWWTAEELALAYPKRAKDIRAGGLDAPTGDEYFETRPADEGDRRPTGYGDDEGTSLYEADPRQDSDRRHRRKWRVRTCWERQWRTLPHLWEVDTVEIKALDEQQLEAARVLAMRDPQKYKILDRVGCVLRKTVQAGQMILEDVERPNGPIMEIPYARFCPYWFGGYQMGLVDNAVDPQMEYNKRMSQALYLLNAYSQSADKWFNDETKGADPDQLEMALREPGAIITHRGSKPEQVRPPVIPTGPLTVAAQSAEAIGRIMGVREPMEGGVEHKDQSGIALQYRVQQGFRMAQGVFARFAQTRQQAYMGVVELIRRSDVYSMAEIDALIDEEDLISGPLLDEARRIVGPPPSRPPAPNPAAMEALGRLDAGIGQAGVARVAMEYERAARAYQEQAAEYEQRLKQAARQRLMEQLRSRAAGRYGVKVSSSPSTPTLRLAYFQQMVSARQHGMAIPDVAIIEASDWPGKDKLIQQMQQAAAGAAQG